MVKKMPIVKKLKYFRLVNFYKTIGLDNIKQLYISSGSLISEEKVTNKNIFENIDAEGCVLAAGFIDPQVNGFEGCNFWTIAREDSNKAFKLIDEIRLKLALCGVVAFCPTIITAPAAEIIHSVDLINKYIKNSNPEIGSKILGIHIEGVFITKYGVHDQNYVQNNLNIQNIEQFVKPSVVIFTLAPELDKTGDAIKFLQEKGILVSIGHSNASYKQAEDFLNKYNLFSVTHMFNSLRGIEGFLHRGEKAVGLELLRSKLANSKKIDPDKDGIILSILRNKNILCMVIADGVHVNKDIVKFLWEVKGPKLFALASDLVSNDFYKSSAYKGMLGGSQLTLERCVSNLIKWKVSSLEHCLRAASEPVSNQLKVASSTGLGKISFGKEANIVLWDTNKNSVKGTIIGENIFLNY